MRTSQSAPAPPLFALCVHDISGSASAFEFCLRNRVLGVGCGISFVPLDWPRYEEQAIAETGRVHSAARAIYELPDGALIWTRDPRDGGFYLARVIGPWRYMHGAEADACDVHTVRAVEMVACDAAALVPETIANQFAIGAWTLQHIHDALAARRSASTFAELALAPSLGSPTLDEVMSEYLDDHDLETLVSVYLQNRHGYFARPLPPRFEARADTPALRDAHARWAVVRAKRGHQLLARDAQSLPGGPIDEVFVFSPTGTYGPDPAPNVTAVDYEEVVDFIRSERWSLPEPVERWVRRALDDNPAGGL
jgi:hypothetical protein